MEEIEVLKKRRDMLLEISAHRKYQILKRDRQIERLEHSNDIKRGILIWAIFSFVGGLWTGFSHPYWKETFYELFGYGFLFYLGLIGILYLFFYVVKYLRWLTERKK